MYSGILVRFLADRGYGFIAIGTGTDGDRAFFAHVSAFQKCGIDFPRVGSRFEFDTEQRQDGKWRAINLRVIDDTAR